MRFFLVLCLFSLFSCNSMADPKVSKGSIRRFTKFPSRQVAARNIDVWLPEGYSPSKKYDVLYMHDGQMLFDSTQTWNAQEWRVDETLSKLIEEGKIRPCIVVGIWNSGQDRHSDYFPQKVFESISKAMQDSIYQAQRPNGQKIYNGAKVQSNAYLKFIVEELKPVIDSTFNTYKDKAHTFIAGSSMGGLISMYALCEYPEVFGGAACLSTHWPGIFTLENNPFPDLFITYIRSHTHKPNVAKWYFDCGDIELDAMYPAIQKKVDACFADNRWDTEHFKSLLFKGEGHRETAWASRLAIPMTFLLKP